MRFVFHFNAAESFYVHKNPSEKEDQNGNCYNQGKNISRSGDNIINKDPAALQRLWDCAAEAFGGADVWINNAGMSIERKPLWEQSDEALEGLVTTNLTGVIFGSKVAIRNMLAQGGGQVWSTEGFGSDGATQTGMVAYGSTKRAVRYVQKGLRKDTANTPVAGSAAA